MAFFDIVGSLGQTLIGGGGSNVPDARRVPFNFTSTKRLRTLDPSLSAQSFDFFTNTQIANAARENAVIQMLVNPNSVSWRQPKRIVKRDTQEGSVFFHFSNSLGENNDLLVLDFRGNTGLIDPRGDIESNEGVFSTNLGSNTGAVKKLLAWQDLWKLTREPMLLEDSTINEFLISYSSIAVRLEIELIGFFNEVMSWEDSAEKPFTKDYSFSFTVQETVPPLEEIVEVLQTAVFDPSITTTV